jgi:hypothetical protein
VRARASVCVCIAFLYTELLTFCASHNPHFVSYVTEATAEPLRNKLVWSIRLCDPIMLSSWLMYTNHTHYIKLTTQWIYTI